MSKNKKSHLKYNFIKPNIFISIYSHLNACINIPYIYIYIYDIHFIIIMYAKTNMKK